MTDPLARLEPIVLACLITAAGAFAAGSIVLGHIGRAIDRAVMWR